MESGIWVNMAANGYREDDRRKFVYDVLIGQDVVVTTSDGAKYKGVLSKINADGLMLRIASLVFDGLDEVKFAKPEECKMIADSGWSKLEAVDVKVGAADVGPIGAMDDAGGFGTDSAISRGKGGLEGRKLEKWTPDPDLHHQGGLEDMSSAHRGWDQFALNESRFGVKSDYQEELYTTALDPSKSKITIEEANRIAAEIEKGISSSATTNVHLLEERGMEIDDGNYDEEARYGAVIRTESAYGYKSVKPGGVQSASIPIDPRKETNKVRAHITGSKTSSPYGTPKLESPLISDAKKFEALNLEPGVTKVDEETRREFEAFKAKQSSKQSEAAESGEKKKSTLNPNAKSFSFNINAKEFNPSSFSKPAQDNNAARPRTHTGFSGYGGTPPPPPPPDRTQGLNPSTLPMQGMMHQPMMMINPNGMPNPQGYLMMRPGMYPPASGGFPPRPMMYHGMMVPPMAYGEAGFESRSPNSSGKIHRPSKNFNSSGPSSNSSE